MCDLRIPLCPYIAQRIFAVVWDYSSFFLSLIYQLYHISDCKKVEVTPELMVFLSPLKVGVVQVSCDIVSLSLLFFRMDSCECAESMREVYL